ncbi:hypothetical protein, partial [Ruminococcus champanellensis]
LQPGCPPFPGLSPQDIGKTLLRIWSTQSIKNKLKANGHKGKLVLRVPNTQSIKENPQKTDHSNRKKAGLAPCLLLS